MEMPFFFENDGAELFGMFHQIDTDLMENTNRPRLNMGMIFCSPFAEEKLWSHRVLVNFARFLSQRGYPVLRFDQRGHGDSDGEFSDTTVESYLSDISRATETLYQRTDVKIVGLLGLRLGATMAALAAHEVGADFLVLWEPVIRGDEYFHRCLRSNLATQLLLYHKVEKNREQLVDDLNRGDKVNIDGYLISPEFYHQVSGIDLMENPGAIDIPVFLASIKKRHPTHPTDANPEYEMLSTLYCSSNSSSVYREITEEPFWTELKIYFQRSEVLFSDTLSWIENLTEDLQFREAVDKKECHGT